MAITINKNKSKPKAKGLTPLTKAKTTKALVNPLVDELGVDTVQCAILSKKLETLKKAIKTKEAQIMAELDLSDSDGEYLVEGNDYATYISAKGNVSTLTNKNLAMAMLQGVKDGLYLELAKVSITDLKAYLTPQQFETIVSTQRTGNRAVKTLKK